ncbi:MAG: hypothetical protein ACPG19_14650 [Saprospiraceae bacterium]
MDNIDNLLGIGSRIRHDSYGHGVIIKLNYNNYEVCFIDYGIKEFAKKFDSWQVIERIEPEDSMTFSKMERSLVSILKKWSDVSEIIPLGDKWKKGKMILKPYEDDLKPKEIEIETFFHKIVMVRDRVRVMEQRINSSKNLNDEEKINLQQYISRIYGSLTTFNVLFKYKEHQFKGGGK